MRTMSGFAQASYKDKKGKIEVILRTVNSKYLDIVIQGLPTVYMRWERQFKKLIAQKIKRGRVEVNFNIHVENSVSVNVNWPILHQYISQMNKIRENMQLENKLGLRDLINLPGVITLLSKSELREKKTIFNVFHKALNDLVEFKIKEGRNIQKDIQQNLNKLKENWQKIRSILKESSYKENTSNNKEDIQEEVSLMGFYIKRMDNLIKKNKSVIGKDTDFLSQEILRELNTASAKTTNIALSYLIVESKSYLERIREQIQNVE